MPLDQAANFVRGTTDTAIDSTQTTVSVVDASIFPDPANGEYNVVIWDVNQYPRPDQDSDVEILRVTAVDTGTDELTVTRGREGTTGVSHPSGSAVHLSPTAKMFSDISQEFDDTLPRLDTLSPTTASDTIETLSAIFDPDGWTEPYYGSGPAHGEGSKAFRRAALAPDGRVIFAPFDSSNVGIFDPSDNSYTSGPAHGEGSNAFRGAALAPDGRVIFAALDSSNVGIFDPSDNSYTSGPAHGEGSGAFRGAALAPDGRVIFAPYDSSNVGIFDPSDNSYTSGPAHGEGANAFRGAALAPDGRVIFAPFNSSNVGIFDGFAEIEKPRTNSTHPLIN